jgi:hypothetical protein
MTGFVIFVVVMIVVGLISKAAKQRSAKSSGTPSPRVQKLLERIQAQQGGSQPTQLHGQFTHAAGQSGPAQSTHPGTAPGSQQVAAALQQLLQAGRQPQHLGERPSPGQPTPHPPAPSQSQPPATWLPNQPPAHRPPQNNLPAPKQDIDTRVRELMRTGSEVAAIRLLCDERDMGILEAQEYARGLVNPAGTTRVDDAEPEEETRYVGSAAFAESIFDLDREQDVWASGWVDTPEPEDRTDIDELWETVRNPPRPGVTPAS